MGWIRREMGLISFLLLLLLLPVPPPAKPLPWGQWQSVLYLSRALFARVADARAGRGDAAGAERARQIADKINWGFSFWGWVFSLARDYRKNYWSWTPELLQRTQSSFGALFDLSDGLDELRRIESNSERAVWVAENYQKILGLSDSLIKQLLLLFAKAGALRETVLVLKTEVEEGDLLRDCLELGANDLVDFLGIIARDLFTFGDSDGCHTSYGRRPTHKEL